MENLNLLVPYYLMSSYLYYQKDISLFQDEQYDKICKTILDNWNKIKHRHKKLIKKKHLEAGTGFYLKNRDYPLIVKISAHQLYKNKTDLNDIVKKLDII